MADGYIDMRGMTAEQADAALVLAQRNRALARVAELEKLHDAAAKANEALELIGEQARQRIVELTAGLREALDEVGTVEPDFAKVDRLRKLAKRAEAETPATPKPRAQHDPGAHVIMREAVETLREQRDAHGNKADRYDKLTLAARNLRDAFEWLWPLLWRDDPEFVPFAERKLRTP